MSESTATSVPVGVTRGRVAATRSRVRRWLLGCVAVVSLLAGGVYLAHRPLLRAVAEFLVVQEATEASTYAVVLAGDFNHRPRLAADLMRRGLVREILVAQVELNAAERRGLVPDRSSLQVQMLRVHGVPEAAIVRLDAGLGVTSTYEEALAVRRYLEGRDRSQTLTIVTSAFHTRRARWVFRRVLGDVALSIRAVPAPHGSFDTGNWWTTEDGLITVFNEYVKLGFYLVNY